jgi:DNA-nicking Smr family endonuclease
VSTRKLTLDLHPIFNRGVLIDQALADALDEAERTKARQLEIIYGKGSGQLRKRVLRFLDRKQVRARYHRIDKDRANHGRVFVHFRWERGQ